MASDQHTDPENVTWGEVVRITSAAASVSRPGEVGQVVGIYKVPTSEIAASRGCSIGDTFVTVEFGDGFTTEVASKYVIHASYDDA